jgi:hypothetical protein
MPRRSIATRFQALFRLPSEGTFQRSLALLVRYRSRGVFSLGSRCLPYSRGISNPRYSGTGAHSSGRRYGAFTLYRAPFQETSRRRSSADCQPIHHIGQRGQRPRDLQFGLYRVHSRLLTTSRLISLPPDTEMFQFSGFPIARSNCGEDSYSEISSSFPPCGSLELIAAWHVLRRHSSRAIHRVA